jgi:hypothetical protein
LQFDDVVTMTLVYFSICGLLWVVPGIVVYYAWRLAVAVRLRRRREQWAAWSLVGVAALLIVFHYLFMLYPSAVRYAYGTRAGGLLDLFVPADWVFDHTPLRAGILKVGEIWGVDELLERHSQIRLNGHYWGYSNPWLDVATWIGIAFVAGACLVLLRRALRRRLGWFRGANTADSQTQTP